MKYCNIENYLNNVIRINVIGLYQVYRIQKQWIFKRLFWFQIRLLIVFSVDGWEYMY